MNGYNFYFFLKAASFHNNKPHVGYKYLWCCMYILPFTNLSTYLPLSKVLIYIYAMLCKMRAYVHCIKNDKNFVGPKYYKSIRVQCSHFTVYK